MLCRIVAVATCVITLACLSMAGNGAAAKADRPATVCAPGVTDDRLASLPQQLVARARQIFALNMPDDLVRKTTVYRCVDGATLLCTTGADLACGKANVRHDPVGVKAWCRDHVQSDFIPMFVTGHDTIYRWRCSDGQPRIEGMVESVDARGFIARNWRHAGPE